MIKQLFCGHDYQLIHEHTSKSALEVTLDKMGGQVQAKGRVLDNSKTYVQTFKCTKCNKIKRYVEVI